MARATTPPPVIVAPSNNVYTALAFVGLVGVLLSLAVLFLRGGTLQVNWHWF